MACSSIWIRLMTACQTEWTNQGGVRMILHVVIWNDWPFHVKDPNLFQIIFRLAIAARAAGIVKMSASSSIVVLGSHFALLLLLCAGAILWNGYAAFFLGWRYCCEVMRWSNARSRRCPRTKPHSSSEFSEFVLCRSQWAILRIAHTFYSLGQRGMLSSAKTW